MRIKNLVQSLSYEYLTNNQLDFDFNSGYTSDLLSDVMANAKEGSILITIQAHKNTVAVASLLGLPAILICNNRDVPKDMLDAAENENIAILRTPENQFNSSYQIRKFLEKKS